MKIVHVADEYQPRDAYLANWEVALFESTVCAGSSGQTRIVRES